eukprot:GHVR01077877.1.p1 GENE.GHVR01077877.1~~GHVR01077877.1.p1  ORF type:complete len:431 (+),score=34.71 GHVR01077877.1:664-1956(+)
MIQPSILPTELPDPEKQRFPAHTRPLTSLSMYSGTRSSTPTTAYTKLFNRRGDESASGDTTQRNSRVVTPALALLSLRQAPLTVSGTPTDLNTGKPARPVTAIPPDVGGILRTSGLFKKDRPCSKEDKKTKKQQDACTPPPNPPDLSRWKSADEILAAAQAYARVYVEHTRRRAHQTDTQVYMQNTCNQTGTSSIKQETASRSQFLTNAAKQPRPVELSKPENSFLVPDSSAKSVSRSHVSIPLPGGQRGCGPVMGGGFRDPQCLRASRPRPKTASCDKVLDWKCSSQPGYPGFLFLPVNAHFTQKKIQAVPKVKLGVPEGVSKRYYRDSRCLASEDDFTRDSRITEGNHRTNRRTVVEPRAHSVMLELSPEEQSTMQNVVSFQVPSNFAQVKNTSYRKRCGTPSKFYPSGSVSPIYSASRLTDVSVDRR